LSDSWLGIVTRLQQFAVIRRTSVEHHLVQRGIEAGQVLALAIMLLFVGWRSTLVQALQHTFNYGWSLPCFLFLMQMHGYSHVSNPDEFGFSADNHFHEHIKLDEALLRNSPEKQSSVD